MAFCAKCGSQVEGRFCAKCGTPVDAGASTGSGPAPSPSANTGLGMDENVAAALCYIPIIGLIFLLVDPYKQNRTIRFHALQSIFYCIGWIIIGVALGVVGSVMLTVLPFAMWGLWGGLSGLIELALFAGLVVMAVKAFQRQRFVMPIVGPMAEKQAGA